MLIHGSPADRGKADAYYGRKPEPHKKVNGERILLTDGDEITEYWDAFHNEPDRKEWE